MSDKYQWDFRKSDAVRWIKLSLTKDISIRNAINLDLGDATKEKQDDAFGYFCRAYNITFK